MNLRNAARSLKKSIDSHRPLVEVGISRENLLHNLHVYQASYPHLTFAPVLKSNAYGHGLTVIAELLDKERIAFFMVDSYYEARTLRRAGIRSRIAVIGYVRPDEIASNRLMSIDYGIVDILQLRELARIAKKPTRIHLKLDTGMHRHGIQPQDIEEAIRIIKSNTHLVMVGVCSHFADADNPDPTHNESQISQWLQMTKRLVTEFPTIEYRHITATKGVAFGDAAHTNVGRLGIGLYGFDTSPHSTSTLKPVLEMRSILSSVRDVPAGDYIGYNATFIADKNIRVGTVPVGYFEGLDRKLSNAGSLLVKGMPCPIVGRISMNMSGIDVSDVPDARSGDAVLIISRHPDEPNSVSSMVKLIDVPGYTEYVVLAHIPQHLKRVVE